MIDILIYRRKVFILAGEGVFVVRTIITYASGGGMKNKHILLFMSFILFFYPVAAFSEWSSMSNGTTNNLYGVWGSSGSDVFAVGTSDTILHYDGSAWSAMSSGTSTTFSDVWGTSGTDVFAVGYRTILHYNGSTWSAMTSGTTGRLNGVWGSSGSDVFAVGDFGTILHYNGSTWSPMASGTTDSLYDVWCSSGNDVFVVGVAGTIMYYNGTDWSFFTGIGPMTRLGVWGSSGSDVFAVGTWGTIFHYNGNSWSSMGSVIPEISLNGVWGSSGSDVFAVGEAGTILHYDGTVTTTSTVPPSSTTTTVIPTIVSLVDFNPNPGNRVVALVWSTKSEIDNAGFNLYRSEAEDGEYVQLNDALISAEGSATQGASYKFIDTDVQNRKTYYYKLEDIDLNGISTMHGPVSATPRWILGIFGIFKK